MKAAAVLNIVIAAKGAGQTQAQILKTDAAMKRVEKSAGRATGALGQVAKNVALIGGAATVAGLGYAVKKAADFESQMSSLGSVTDATGKQMDRFRKQALKAGADTKFSALEAAEAQTELAKGGLRLSQIMRGGLKSSLALAAAGEMELAEAAETTVNAMKLFGLRGKDAMKVADGLAKAANMTTADVSDFALALKQGGGAAKAAGLDFNETVAALSALAEMGIKGSDAGTSLKAALTQLASPTKKSLAVMDELGLSFFDAEGNMKPLAKVAGMLQDKLGGLTREQRLATTTTLVGTDGMRALLALYDAGPNKIRKYQRQLGESGTAAEVAKRKQDNLKGSLEQFKGSMETLGIQFGTMLIPAIRGGADELTKFTNKINRIVSRDDLDLGEKLQKSFDVAKVSADPWIDKLGDAIEKADLPKRLGDAISIAAPAMAEGAAKAAPAAAKAFVETFMESNAWGKLAIGGFLATKLGVSKKIMDGLLGGGGLGGGGKGLLGNKPIPVFVTNPGGMPGKGGGPSIIPTAGKTAFAVGMRLVPVISGSVLAGYILVKAGQNNFKTSGAGGSSPSNPAGHVPFDPGALTRRGMGGAAPGAKVSKDESLAAAAAGADQLAKRVRAVTRDIRGMRDGTLKDVGEISAAATDHFGKVRDTIGLNTREGRQLADKNMSGAVTAIGDAMGRGRATTDQGMSAIQSLMKNKSRGGKDGLERNYDLAIGAIRKSMTRGGEITKKGLEVIRGLMVEQLKLYGLSPRQALNIAKSGDGGYGDPDANRGREAGHLRNQRGGPVFGGLPSGDSIPSLLERGEYVVNRKAVKKVGKHALDRLNFGSAPRFQEGGIVELLHPFNDPKGHGGSNSHLHVAMSNIGALVALGRRLQSMGWLVGEHPAFGGIQGSHAPQGYHPRGQAIDVNWPNAGEEGAKIKALLPMLNALSTGGGGAGGAAAQLKRLLVTGPGSPLKSITQGALDMTTAAAQSVLDKATGGFEGTEMGANWKGSWVDLMGSISKQRGWSLAAWKRLVQKESGGDPTARNPSSGAFGLGQFLGSTARAYAKHGALSSDPVDQIRAMAQYISDRYGSPSSALAFHDANNWYDAGGLVGSAGRGRSGLAGSKNARGPIAQAIHNVRAGKSPKIRKNAVQKLLARIRGIGLPESVQSSLNMYSKNAGIFGDYADRAATLTDEGGITDALQAELERRQGLGLDFPAADQQAMVDQMLGRVSGKTQLDWLHSQLGSLFNWRNTIIEAEKIVVERREETTRLIEQARKRLDAIRGAITEAAKLRARYAKQLEEAQKHPKRNRAQIKRLRGEIKAIDRAQRPRMRVREALTGKILPGLRDHRKALNAGRGDLLDNLGTVQGAGAPTNRMASLPAIDVLGGDIFSARSRIKELTDKPIRVVAETTGPSETDSERASILAELLRFERQRTGVSERQFDVFKGAPRFGGGGVVNAPTGAAVPAVVHGGEGVFTREQMAAMGGGGGVRVIIHGDIVSSHPDPVEVVLGDRRFPVAVERVNRQQARTGNRQLPGRGGGLLG